MGSNSQTEPGGSPLFILQVPCKSLPGILYTSLCILCAFYRLQGWGGRKRDKQKRKTDKNWKQKFPSLNVKRYTTAILALGPGEDRWSMNNKLPEEVLCAVGLFQSCGDKDPQCVSSGLVLVKMSLPVDQRWREKLQEWKGKNIKNRVLRTKLWPPFSKRSWSQEESRPWTGCWDLSSPSSYWLQLAIGCTYLSESQWGKRPLNFPQEVPGAENRTGSSGCGGSKTKTQDNCHYTCLKALQSRKHLFRSSAK